ncbi:MAG TPA: hypothetical protein VFL93_07175 [Longimicrobiaceae bacterium]|nr:hypothetical protein [Longimicrobiaceae bacterium]
MRAPWIAPLVVALALLSGGCSDGPTGSRPADEARLTISAFGAVSEDATIGVDDSLHLSAALITESGKTLTGSVTWRTSDATVANLLQTEGDTVVVVGLKAGAAEITATSGSATATEHVTVALPVTGQLTCGPGDPSITPLAVGQALSMTGDQVSHLCVDGGVAGGEYTLVAFNSALVSDARLSLDVAASDIVSAAGPPRPNVGATPFTTSLKPRLVPDAALHLRMLESSHDRTASRLRSAALLPVAAPRLANVPSLGSEMRLNADVESSDGCSNPTYRMGRVVAVSTHAILVEDESNPSGGFTTAQYDSIAQEFDRDVWPVDTENFGTPEDIDGNGRAIIFYTRAVNEMTKSGSDEYIGGFFYNRDLFPTSGQNACKGSNHAEMFYMLVPDPGGEVNGNIRSVPFVRGVTVGVLAHEFQHLINDSRRLYVNHAPAWEEPWLNEGLSHIAEELMFYRKSGLQPKQNIGPDQLKDGTALQAYNEFEADNVSRLIRFLQAPDQASLMGGDELSTRGAIWSFLRYAADRDPAGDKALWNALVKNTTTSGLQNLGNALGVNPRDWMRDWGVSVYTDDALPGVAAEYSQPSWNMRALIPALRTESGAVGRYPLYAFSLGFNPTARLTLQGGGVAYARFGVEPAARAGLRVTSGGLPAPEHLKIILVRTK